MDLYISIKISAIIVTVICCITAAYTDVKYGVIPNKLTIPVILIGLTLTTAYFVLLKSFNLFYYLSVGIVFSVTYLAWRIGIWAGGDVKLFTAISTLLIPEFMNVIPKYNITSLILPLIVPGYSIPTLWLIFNSILSVVPLIVLLVMIVIFKNKPYLIKELLDNNDIYSCLFVLNMLVINYLIISYFNVYNLFIKVVFMLISTAILAKLVKKNKYIIILSTGIIILYQFLSENILSYVIQLLFILCIYVFGNMMRNNVISQALTTNYNLEDLNEGMILAYPLCYYNNTYFFDKTSIFEKLKNTVMKKENNKIIIPSLASGVSCNDISLLKKTGKKNIPIKRGLPFAPFILCGLILTLTLGNTVRLFILLLELI